MYILRYILKLALIELVTRFILMRCWILGSRDILYTTVLDSRKTADSLLVTSLLSSWLGAVFLTATLLTSVPPTSTILLIIPLMLTPTATLLLWLTPMSLLFLWERICGRLGRRQKRLRKNSWRWNIQRWRESWRCTVFLHWRILIWWWQIIYDR